MRGYRTKAQRFQDLMLRPYVRYNRWGRYSLPVLPCKCQRVAKSEMIAVMRYWRMECIQEPL